MMATDNVRQVNQQKTEQDPLPVEEAESENKNVLITPDGQELDLSITGTMKLNPDEGKVSKNKNRLASVKYAIAGLLYLLRREQSIQFASVTTVIVVIVGIWLGVNPIYWAILTLSLGLIWAVEALNTAIESAINLGTSDPHPLAKIGKDTASTAALAATIVFVIVCLLILLPRIVDRLQALSITTP